MKNLFKIMIGMIVCAVQLSASSYEWNQSELNRFANSMVNVTPEVVVDVLGTYFDMYPDRHRLHPQHVSGSIMMSPNPGKKGNIDETLTALRFDPMNNWYISLAQYMFALQALNDKVSALDAISIENLNMMLKTADAQLEEKKSDNESLKTKLSTTIDMIGEMQDLINLMEEKSSQNANRINDIKSNLQSLAQRTQLTINL